MILLMIYKKMVYNLGFGIYQWLLVLVLSISAPISVDIIGLMWRPDPGGYGDATATYIRRAMVPSRMYAKHQYNTTQIS